jgi:hypothetical protein
MQTSVSGLSVKIGIFGIQAAYAELWTKSVSGAGRCTDVTNYKPDRRIGRTALE